MSKNRKKSRRKRRREKKDKLKSVGEFSPTKSCPDIGYDEVQEDIKDLLRAPGAVMWFFNEKGERKAKIKVADV